MNTNSLQSFKPSLLIAGVALIVAAFGGLFLASDWAMASGRGTVVDTDTQTAASVEDESTECRHCGVVESVRRLAPVGKAAANYEIAIRVGGERQLIQDTSPTKWRPGERMILIAGRDAPPK